MIPDITLGTFLFAVDQVRRILGPPSVRPPGSTYRGIPGTGPPILSVTPVVTPTPAPPIFQTPPFSPPTVTPGPAPGTAPPTGGPPSVPMSNPGTLRGPTGGIPRIRNPPGYRPLNPAEVQQAKRQYERIQQAREAADRARAERIRNRYDPRVLDGESRRVPNADRLPRPAPIIVGVLGRVAGIAGALLYPSIIGKENLPEKRGAPVPAPAPQMPDLPAPALEVPPGPEPVISRPDRNPTWEAPRVDAPEPSQFPMPTVSAPPAPAPAPTAPRLPAPSPAPPLSPLPFVSLLPILRQTNFRTPSRSPFRDPLTPSQPNPFTPAQPNPIVSAPPAPPSPLTPSITESAFGPRGPNARECAPCEKGTSRKRKREKSCTNPIVSRSRRVINGQPYSFVKRKLICPSSKGN